MNVSASASRLTLRRNAILTSVSKPTRCKTSLPISMPIEKFLPDGLALADVFTTLSAGEKRLVSQIQGRTYANVFGLVERFINAKVLELSPDHWFGDQVALEALVRFSDEELKHQALFRRIDAMTGEVLPKGYRFDVDPTRSPTSCSARVHGRCWH